MKQTNLSVIIFLLFAAVYLTPIPAYAITRTMSACSSAAWDSAYSAASSGDTIAFPSGSCLVNMTKDIGKQNLLVQGAGAGTTIVTGGFTCSGTACNGLRITAIQFNTGPAFEWNDNPHTSPLQNFRLDHCIFNNGAYFTQFYGSVPHNAVIDHNTYQNITGSGNYVFGNPYSTAIFPFTLGTGDAVYYEDNIINDTGGTMGHFITTRQGSRYVVRYNEFNLYGWDPIDAHDNYEGQNERGSFTWEVYNNKITYSGTGKRIMHFRGGQGVVFNNVTNNNQSTGISLNSYMICEGICSSDIDPATKCQDHINHTYIWNNKQSCGSLASCDVHNISSCCSGGSSWNAVADCSGGGSNQGLVEGTDYYNSAQPGYTPYAYPHPLVSGGMPVQRKLNAPAATMQLQ